MIDRDLQYCYSCDVKNAFLFLDALVIRDALFPGSLQTPIFLSGLRCDSATDTNILDCEAAAWGITKCSHDQDVIVHCEGNCLVD